MSDIEDLINKWAEDNNIEFPSDGKEKAIEALLEMLKEGRSPVLILRWLKSLGVDYCDIDY